ncbi:MAG: FAD-binding protein, partial [Pirellulaceae bacterium]
VHYSMGGLWADYVRTAEGGLEAGNPRNQMTNIEGLYAIGECDYHYHGANRLGANSLLSCIFTGLFTGPGIANYIENVGEPSASDVDAAVRTQQARHDDLLKNTDGGENPYLIHQELGDVMTRAATVVRKNDQLREAMATVDDLHQRIKKVSLSDTGTWTNQNVIFAKAVQDMFPLAKTLLKGALQRDECRGAHFKPEFSMPELTSTDEAQRRQEAEAWCDRFEENNRKFLKSTIATWNGSDVDLTYEDVDTSLIPPRPRLYGLKGAEVISEVWKERAAAQKLEKEKVQI